MLGTLHACIVWQTTDAFPDCFLHVLHIDIDHVCGELSSILAIGVVIYSFLKETKSIQQWYWQTDWVFASKELFASCLDRGKAVHHVLVGNEWVGNACRLLSYNALSDSVLWPRTCAEPHSLKPQWMSGSASTSLSVLMSVWIIDSLRSNSPWSEPPCCTLWSSLVVTKHIPSFH